jgi:hypothetical protein
MTLGNFVPRQRISGDKLNLSQYVGRPLLVRTNEFVPDFSSQAYPNPKPVVFCDVVDLASGQIFINVLWGGGAVVDNLKEYAGTEIVMPVMPGVGTGQSGRNYQLLNALEGDMAQLAQGWYQQYWPMVDQERAKRESASKPFQTPAPAAAPVQQGFQPPAPQQFAAPAAQPPANPAYAQQAPATQQYAPAAQQFAQPVPQGNAQPFAQPAPQQQQFAQPVPQGNAQPFAQPAAQLPHDQQGFAPPQAQQFQPPAPQGNVTPAPQGMFTDGPPPADPAAMLAQLNNQLS